MTGPSPKKLVIVEEASKALIIISSDWLLPINSENNNKKQYWLPKNVDLENMQPLYELKPKDETRPDIKWKKHKYEEVISYHDSYNEANAKVVSITTERSFSSTTTSSGQKSFQSGTKPLRRPLFSPIGPKGRSQDTEKETNYSTWTEKETDNSTSIIIKHLEDVLRRIHRLEENNCIMNRKLKGINDIKKVLYEKFFDGAGYTSSDYASDVDPEDKTSTPRKQITSSVNVTPRKNKSNKKTTPRNSPSKKFTPWRDRLELTIDNTTDFMSIENKLTTDQEYLSAFRKFLKYVGNRACNVEKKMEVILSEVFSLEITDYFNTNGLYEKKNISKTKIIDEINNAIKQQVITANDKEISKALSKVLKSMYNKLRRDRQPNKPVDKNLKAAEAAEGIPLETTEGETSESATLYPQQKCL